MPKILSDQIEMKALEDGTLKIKVLGVPFGSPENRDFHGEYFTAKTFFADGDGTAPQEFYATLDHAVNVNPKTGQEIMPLEKMFIGTAKYVGTDPDLGRWYEISVKKGEEYRQMLEALHGKGMLRASSQTMGSSAKIAPDGEILAWPVVEVALTTASASPDAVAEVVKSIDTENEDFQNFIKHLESIAELPEDPATEEDLNEIAEGWLKGLDDTQNIATVLGSIDARLDTLEKVWGDFSVFIDLFGSLEDESLADILRAIQSDMESVKTLTQTSNKSTTRLETAFKTFGEGIANRLKMQAYQITDSALKSRTEQEEEERPRRNVLSSAIPPGAPGHK